MYRDDDDTEPLSSTHSLERGDHRKKERQDVRKSIERKKNLAQLRRDVLRKELPGQPVSKEVDRRRSAVTTKTNEQELKDRIANIHMKPTTEKLIKQEETEEAAKEAAPYEEQKDAE